MSPDSLRLLVLTPMETLLDVASVTRVQARLVDGGGIGILPGHAPLIAETVEAPLGYADEHGGHTLGLEAGILHIEHGTVTVLTSGVSNPETQVDEAHRGRGSGPGPGGE